MGRGLVGQLAHRVATVLMPSAPPALTAQLGNVQQSDWFATPLKPDQLIDGAPNPRSVRLAVSGDTGFVTFLWECDRGRFRWVFRSDELVHILEGSVEIREQDGRTYTLRAGDVAQFPLGLSTEWNVTERLRKLAVHRSDVSVPDQVRERLRRLAR